MFFPGDDLLETIAAAATTPLPGARAVVRLAGREARSIAQQLFVPASGMFVHHSVQAGNLSVDDVRVPACAWVFCGPNSYTGDDIVELHLVSSPALIQRLLRKACAHGARLARAGEFTRRALLSGRISLKQAQAVLDLSQSQELARVESALGALQTRTHTIDLRLRSELIAILSHIEASLDFAAEGLEQELQNDLRLAQRLADLQTAVAATLSREAGRSAPDHNPSVVLLGRANAGKSSLFNALAGHPRALTSPVAGTTRDPLHTQLQTEAGSVFTLCDPAGIADEPRSKLRAESIDREAQRRATHLAARASLAVLVVDASAPASDMRYICEQASSTPALIVLNKTDLVAVDPCALIRSFRESNPGLGNHDPSFVLTSAVSGRGLADLLSAIARLLPRTGPEFAAIGLGDRQLQALKLCAEKLARAAEALANQASELATIDLHTALDALSEVSGDIHNEQILDELFARFCIGK